MCGLWYGGWSVLPVWLLGFVVCWCMQWGSVGCDTVIVMYFVYVWLLSGLCVFSCVLWAFCLKCASGWGVWWDVECVG